MKKKLFALFLAVLTFCGLAGCSYSVDSEPSFTQSPMSSPTAYTPEPATPAPTLEPTTTMTERATQTPEKTQKNSNRLRRNQRKHNPQKRKTKQAPYTLPIQGINTIVPAAAILKSPSMQSHCPMQKHRGIRLARSVNHKKYAIRHAFLLNAGQAKANTKPRPVLPRLCPDFPAV